MVKLYTQQQHDMMREGGSVWQLRRWQRNQMPVHLVGVMVGMHA